MFLIACSLIIELSLQQWLHAATVKVLVGVGKDIHPPCDAIIAQNFYLSSLEYHVPKAPWCLPEIESIDCFFLSHYYLVWDKMILIFLEVSVIMNAWLCDVILILLC